jgi:hypothetical protein
MRGYSVLGNDSHEIFPIHFSSQVNLVGGIVAGTVPGFLALEDFRSGKVKVIR